VAKGKKRKIKKETSAVKQNTSGHYVGGGIIITRDYFDATASNWNTSTQSLPLVSLCIKMGSQIGGMGVF